MKFNDHGRLRSFRVLRNFHVFDTICPQFVVYTEITEPCHGRQSPSFRPRWNLAYARPCGALNIWEVGIHLGRARSALKNISFDLRLVKHTVPSGKNTTGRCTEYPDWSCWSGVKKRHCWGRWGRAEDTRWAVHIWNIGSNCLYMVM